MDIRQNHILPVGHYPMQGDPRPIIITYIKDENCGPALQNGDYNTSDDDMGDQYQAMDVDA